MNRKTRLVVSLLWAWAISIVAYVGSLFFIWGEWVGGDLYAVISWSGLALLVAVPLFYGPVLVGLRFMLGGYKPLILFPLVAALLGIIPTGLIVRVMSGSLLAMTSPEAVLFYILFGVFGVVVGVGFAWPERRSG